MITLKLIILLALDPHSSFSPIVTKEELIDRSPFIAVVELSGIPPLMLNDASLGGVAIPTQHATAKVLQPIEGVLPVDIFIENEAHSILTNGKQLAFFKRLKEKNGFILSAPNALRKIDGDKVFWFPGDASLEVVIKEIKKLLQRKKPNGAAAMTPAPHDGIEN